MGWPKIKISTKDLVFEEISTRPLQQKRFEDFLSKTVEVTSLLRKYHVLFSKKCINPWYRVTSFRFPLKWGYTLVSTFFSDLSPMSWAKLPYVGDSCWGLQDIDGPSLCSLPRLCIVTAARTTRYRTVKYVITFSEARWLTRLRFVT